MKLKKYYSQFNFLEELKLLKKENLPKIKEAFDQVTIRSSFSFVQCITAHTLMRFRKLFSCDKQPLKITEIDNTEALFLIDDLSNKHVYSINKKDANTLITFLNIHFENRSKVESIEEESIDLLNLLDKYPSIKEQSLYALNINMILLKLLNNVHSEGIDLSDFLKIGGIKEGKVDKLTEYCISEIKNTLLHKDEKGRSNLFNYLLDLYDPQENSPKKNWKPAQRKLEASAVLNIIKILLNKKEATKILEEKHFIESLDCEMTTVKLTEYIHFLN